MNDFWNDPPNEPDIPICKKCDEDMIINNDGSAICPKCQTKIEPSYLDADPPDEPIYNYEDVVMSEKNSNSKCPHGKEFVECNYCYYESDFAYDVARENKWR